MERGLAFVRRNLVLLLICFAVVPAAALVYSLLQTKEYTASASLLFGATSLDQKLSASGVSSETDPERAAATNLKLVSLDRIAVLTAEAIDESGVTPGTISESVSVSPEGESDLISIDATDESPAFATRLANTFARQYVSFRREIDRTKVAKAQALIEARIAELSPSERTSEAGADLERRQRQLEVLSALQTGDAELVQPATVPSSPSSPKTSRNVALGILLGILLGIGLALLREQFDRRVRDIDDVEAVFDLPVLGTIPQSRAILNSGPGSQLAPTGMEGEAFRMLRVNLRYFSVDRDVKTVLITSAAPQDGKTTVAWNLALADARAGERVLYLEADLRRPSLGETLGIESDEGLSLVLAGAGEAPAAIQKVQGVDLIPAGMLPPNPAELLESQRMVDLLAWAEAEYDRVIVDTPPAAVVADAISLFNRVDGVLIVTRLQRSPREAAEHLHEQLAHTDAPVLGVVVNGVGAHSDSSYYRSQASTNFPAAAPIERAASDATEGSSRAEQDPPLGEHQRAS